MSHIVSGKYYDCLVNELRCNKVNINCGFWALGKFIVVYGRKRWDISPCVSLKEFNETFPTILRDTNITGISHRFVSIILQSVHHSMVLFADGS